MSVLKALRVAVPALAVWFVAASCGPTVTTTPSTLRAVCVHNDMSQWECPDSSAAMSGFKIPASEYEGATMTVRTRSGRTYTVTLNSNIDAVFTSKWAVENFLLRYYDDTDRTKAADLRAHLARNWP